MYDKARYVDHAQIARRQRRGARQMAARLQAWSRLTAQDADVIGADPTGSRLGYWLHDCNAGNSLARRALDRAAGDNNARPAVRLASTRVTNALADGYADNWSAVY